MKNKTQFKTIQLIRVLIDFNLIFNQIISTSDSEFIP